MRKIFTLFLLALVTHIGMVRAQEFTIATCSGVAGNTAYGPMYSTSIANVASRTAVIYPASQITGVAGLITNIYWNRFAATGTIAGTPNFKIYLLEMAATDWGTAAPEWATAITGATLVYDGDPASIVGNSPGWKNFPLTTSFDYSGTKNL